MGTFHVDIEIIGADGSETERHPALVDTGASYLSLPRCLLRRLGYRPRDTQRVIFATGQMDVWQVTEVRLRLEGRERTVIAFLADDAAPNLVGAQTLETFGLGVDPLARRLVPVDAYLAACAERRRRALTSGTRRSRSASPPSATCASRSSPR